MAAGKVGHTIIHFQVILLGIAIPAANNDPRTQASCMVVPRAPRILAGATSDVHIGREYVTIPTIIPVTKREIRNEDGWVYSDQSMAPMVNRDPMQRPARRPKLLAIGGPSNNAPAAAPKGTKEAPQPWKLVIFEGTSAPSTPRHSSRVPQLFFTQKSLANDTL